MLADLLRTEPVDRALVFTRTKHGADKVVRGLQQGRHRRRGDPRQQVAEPARARAGRLPQRPGAHPGGDRHRRPRHRRRGHQPRHQLRPAEHPGELRAPHRPHRARRRRRHRDLALLARRAAVPARHREADPDGDPGDRPGLVAAPIAPAAPASIRPQRRDNGRHRNGRGQAPRTARRPRNASASRNGPSPRSAAAAIAAIGRRMQQQPAQSHRNRRKTSRGRSHRPSRSAAISPTSRSCSRAEPEDDTWQRKNCSNSKAW